MNKKIVYQNQVDMGKGLVHNYYLISSDSKDITDKDLRKLTLTKKKFVNYHTSQIMISNNVLAESNYDMKLFKIPRRKDGYDKLISKLKLRKYKHFSDSITTIYNKQGIYRDYFDKEIKRAFFNIPMHEKTSSKFKLEEGSVYLLTDSIDPLSSTNRNHMSFKIIYVVKNYDRFILYRCADLGLSSLNENIELETCEDEQIERLCRYNYQETIQKADLIGDDRYTVPKIYILPKLRNKTFNSFESAVKAVSKEIFHIKRTRNYAIKELDKEIINWIKSPEYENPKKNLVLVETTTRK